MVFIAAGTCAWLRYARLAGFGPFGSSRNAILSEGVRIYTGVEHSYAGLTYPGHFALNMQSRVHHYRIKRTCWRPVSNVALQLIVHNPMRFSHETPFSRPTGVCCTLQVTCTCAMGHSAPWLLHATTHLANGQHARMQGYIMWAVCTLLGNRHCHVVYALHPGMHSTSHVCNITQSNTTCNVVPCPVHVRRTWCMHVQ